MKSSFLSVSQRNHHPAD